MRKRIFGALLGLSGLIFSGCSNDSHYPKVETLEEGMITIDGRDYECSVNRFTNKNGSVHHNIIVVSNDNEWGGYRELFTVDWNSDGFIDDISPNYSGEKRKEIKAQTERKLARYIHFK